MLWTFVRCKSGEEPVEAFVGHLDWRHWRCCPDCKALVQNVNVIVDSKKRLVLLTTFDLEKHCLRGWGIRELGGKRGEGHRLERSEQGRSQTQFTSA